MTYPVKGQGPGPFSLPTRPDALPLGILQPQETSEVVHVPQLFLEGTPIFLYSNKDTSSLNADISNYLVTEGREGEGSQI